MFTNSPFCSLNYLIAHRNVPFCVHNLPKMFIQTRYAAPHGVSYILFLPPHQITIMTFSWKPQTNVMILTQFFTRKREPSRLHDARARSVS